MLVILVTKLCFTDFNNNLVHFYPGDIVRFKQGIAFGKGVHFDLFQGEYNLFN